MSLWDKESRVRGHFTLAEEVRSPRLIAAAQLQAFMLTITEVMIEENVISASCSVTVSVYLVCEYAIQYSMLCGIRRTEPRESSATVGACQIWHKASRGHLAFTPLGAETRRSPNAIRVRTGSTCGASHYFGKEIAPLSELHHGLL
ncbi:Uncharacterized protein OBRU01_02528 [Operophtera brumata]|uniref:Uncharacterized protein n=1 Tax=Operophtera brumata TaxID=104452 RepID=A0A0L7LQW2_OPEBR|nr:Uncharacterized protein OBRU01_02528 [Operophtera brumata]